jgi:hypothetical protein
MDPQKSRNSVRKPSEIAEIVAACLLHAPPPLVASEFTRRCARKRGGLDGLLLLFPSLLVVRTIVTYKRRKAHKPINSFYFHFRVYYWFPFSSPL